MALDFLRPRVRTIDPGTRMDGDSISHEELVATVNILRMDISRLSREMAALRKSGAGEARSLSGPIPSTPESATSGRALIRLIATQVGRNDDSVRQSLSRGRAFAELREKVPGLTTNVAILRWLATDGHYAKIADGASMADVVAGR